VRLAAAFDHDKTRFPLAGKHAGLACMKCHKGSDFKAPVAHAKCMDCHQDQHKGQFQHRADGGECAACHTDKGFKPATFSNADHRSTGYPLTGKHKDVACSKCHAPAGAETNYHPAFKACIDCHHDPHGGQFAQAPLENRCEECHTVDGFRPSTFSLLRHQSSRFPLKGAHAAVPCLECHRQDAVDRGRGRQFRFANLSCEGCHQDPHLKPPECETCHGLRSWQELKAFDHSLTAFALVGTHRVLACADCHRPAKGADGARQLPFHGAPDRCAGCHEDIHAGQFERDGRPADCALCHTQTHWAATVFDHDKATRFPLSGAHAKVPCRLCHVQRREVNGRSVVLYKATPRECAACHRQ
jgi:hypothetical protein